MVAEHARGAGLYDALIYLVDLQQNVLWPLLGDPATLDRGRTEPTRIDGTLPGKAFSDGDLVVAAGDGEGQEEQRLWMPIVDQCERLGVLSVTVPRHDAASEARLRELATLVALLVVSRRRNSDPYTDLVRVREMSLAAELQWMLMPPMTFANDKVVISGALEPAYEVGGDAFDYTLVGRTAHLAIFDAMGHDTAAGLVASIAMGSYRNNRRRGAGLVETSQAIDADLGRQFDDRFATGVLARLDTETGMLSWVNRGHPVPLTIRQGRWVGSLDCLPTPPMGLGFEEKPLLCTAQLEPGDRLLFYTDGIVEARGSDGEPFGLERFADFVVRREADGLSAPETLRRLVRTLLEYQNAQLQDDATVLMIEWCG
jgi:hypothetical protein